MKSKPKKKVLWSGVLNYATKKEKPITCSHYKPASSKTFRHSTYTISLTWHDQMSNSKLETHVLEMPEMKLCRDCGAAVAFMLKRLKK